MIGRNRVNLIVGWCGRFLFFVVPRQFSQDTREWPENQILITDWTYFQCPGATLLQAEGQRVISILTRSFSFTVVVAAAERRNQRPFSSA